MKEELYFWVDVLMKEAFNMRYKQQTNNVTLKHQTKTTIQCSVQKLNEINPFKLNNSAINTKTTQIYLFLEKENIYNNTII